MIKNEERTKVGLGIGNIVESAIPQVKLHDREFLSIIEASVNFRLDDMRENFKRR